MERINQNIQLNRNIQPNQCCQTPFIQTNSGANIETCLSCGSKTKLIVEFECPYCHNLSEGIIELDLEDSDGNTDWCECNECRYDFRKHELIIRPRKIQLNPN